MENNYEPNEIQLANEIAITLNDPEALPLYLKYTRRYKDTYIKKILARVMSIDENKIKRSRAALFTWLISQAPYDSRR